MEKNLNQLTKQTNLFKNKSVKLFIIGAGGHSRVILDCDKILKHNVLGIIDINQNKKKKENINGVNVYPKNHINNIKKNHAIFLAIGENKLREKYYNKLKKKYKLINLIHPRSLVSKQIEIGKGNYIGPGATINSNTKILNNTIINSRALIEHECIIEDNSHVGPGVKLGGRCIVSKNVFIGIGSVVIDKVKIGEDTVVGAASLVLKNLLKKKTYFGVPVKIKK